MQLLRYLLSKFHRQRINAEYTKELCDKLALEQEQRQEVRSGKYTVSN